MDDRKCCPSGHEVRFVSRNHCQATGRKRLAVSAPERENSSVARYFRFQTFPHEQGERFDRRDWIRIRTIVRKNDTPSKLATGLSYREPVATVHHHDVGTEPEKCCALHRSVED
jgi:hypothetical protein